MPFKKGTEWKGNAGGRPKALGAVLELARRHTDANIARLVELRDQNKDQALAARCAIALHEIAWGRPAQTVDVSGTVNTRIMSLVEKIRRDAPKP
jgi:hypothetical protein